MNKSLRINLLFLVDHVLIVGSSVAGDASCDDWFSASTAVCAVTAGAISAGFVVGCLVGAIIINKEIKVKNIDYHLRFLIVPWEYLPSFTTIVYSHLKIAVWPSCHGCVPGTSFNHLLAYGTNAIRLISINSTVLFGIFHLIRYLKQYLQQLEYQK